MPDPETRRLFVQATATRLALVQADMREIQAGPADLGHYVVTACRRHGFRHDHGYAQRLDTGERVPTDTEEQFFALAGVPCLPPSEREQQAAKLWAEFARIPANAPTP